VTRAMARAWPAGFAGVLALAAALAQSARAQEPKQFPAEAAAITVDVVVLDGKGQPVRGLVAADFTVLDGGRHQSITSFAARERPPAPAAAPVTSLDLHPRTAGNEATDAAPGAFVAVLVDDLGLTAPVAEEAKLALSRWLAERADPRDEMTLLTTSGDVWWSDTLRAGRDDLVASVRRIRGRASSASGDVEMISALEASQIVNFEPHSIGDEEYSPTGERNDPGIPPFLVKPEPRNPSASSLVERVAKRWLDSGACCWCSTSCGDCPPLTRCKARIQMKANDVYGGWHRRAEIVLGALERVSAGLAGMRGRKAVVLVADGFPRDPLLDERYRRVVDAAQRSNTAVYFASARGPGGSLGFGIEQRTAERSGDLGRMGVEEHTLSIGGAEHLADATGGVVTVSNDVAAGLERVSTDASAYYLLGFQPAAALDGKWHDVTVKVARKDVTVRARRGYLATSAVAPAKVARAADAERKGASEKEKKAAAEFLSSPELASGGTHGAIPMRLASYIQGPDGAGAARVLVVLEVDGAHVKARSTPEGRSATLALTVLAVARDRNRVAPLAQSIDVKLADKDLGVWWALFREVRLPPGVSQIRVLVRDKATGAVGTIAQRIDVPDVDAPYLGTPLITDRTQPSPEKDEPPRLVPSAGRRFARDRPLYCQFELFSFGGRSMPGVPQVTGGYTLEREGDVVAEVPPTPIATDAHRVVRRLVLPPEQLEPGLYDLTVTVEDALAQRTLTARESFLIAP